MNQPTTDADRRLPDINEKVSGNSVDPRVRRTRQLLQKALIELLLEMDFNHVTVQAIVERAGVNRATFYAHFEDKFALMNYQVRETFREMIQKRLPVNSDFSADSIRLFILATTDFFQMFNHYYHHCTPLKRVSDAQMLGQVQVILYEVLLDCLTRLHPPAAPTMSPEALANMMSWTIFGATFQWAIGELEISAEQLADQLGIFIGAGLQGGI